MFVSALAIEFSVKACLEWAFREWEGVLNKVFTGKLRPEVQSVRNLHPLTAVNALSLKYE